MLRDMRMLKSYNPNYIPLCVKLQWGSLPSFAFRRSLNHRQIVCDWSDNRLHL